METLAIVPARSGSKGLKDKNILPVNGKPLLTYTLEAAVDSNIFSDIILSTDSELYAKIALNTSGVSVPFLRSSRNSGDVSSTWDTVREVLDNYRKLGKTFDMFCLLQPTSPMRNATHILEAYELYNAKRANSIVSVCPLGHSINICNQLPDDGSLVGFLKRPDKYTRQMNPTYYRLNGAIYMCRTTSFLQFGSIYHEKSYAYIMKERDSVDIDCMDDLEYAEFLLNRYNGIKEY